MYIYIYIYIYIYTYIYIYISKQYILGYDISIIWDTQEVGYSIAYF